MPLGIVSDSEFEDEYNNTNPSSKPSSSSPLSPETNESNNISGEVIDPKPLGRGKGNVEVPESLRKLIGETHNTNGREEALELASYYDISSSSVSAYGHGATSTASYHEHQPELKDHLVKSKERIIKRAHNKLLNTLSNITSDKLEKAKVKDLAVVAKALSGVIKDIEPSKLDEAVDKRPQFIVYAPRMVKEEHYDVINASD